LGHSVYTTTLQDNIFPKQTHQKSSLIPASNERVAGSFPGETYITAARNMGCSYTKGIEGFFRIAIFITKRNVTNE